MHVSKTFFYVIYLFIIILLKKSRRKRPAVESSQSEYSLILMTWRFFCLGGETELPCSLEDKEKGDSVYLVLWYRREDRTPIYSYDSRYCGTWERIGHLYIYSTAIIAGTVVQEKGLTPIYSYDSRYCGTGERTGHQYTVMISGTVVQERG
jgi:predicted nucleic acid-binding Zn ribbon protein